jgi:hypothetical protein
VRGILPQSCSYPQLASITAAVTLCLRFNVTYLLKAGIVDAQSTRRTSITEIASIHGRWLLQVLDWAITTSPQILRGQRSPALVETIMGAATAADLILVLVTA